MISVNTDPPGATVTFSPGGTCITPCNQEVKKKEAIHLTIRKDECRTHTTSMISTISGSGVILGGYIDYGTGAVYRHQPNPLFVHLDCEPAAPAPAPTASPVPSPAPAVQKLREAVTPAIK